MNLVLILIYLFLDCLLDPSFDRFEDMSHLFLRTKEAQLQPLKKEIKELDKPAKKTKGCCAPDCSIM